MLIKTKHISSLVLFFLLAFNKIIFSQFTSLSFERISIDQGLSNNSINSILQTSDGFLWIATKDGLNRFDGKTFKIYKHFNSDSTSLPQNYVMYLFEDNNKNFWIGTWGGGLCKYNPEMETFVRYNHKEKFDDYIQSLYQDRNGFIWFGTLGGGLNKFNPKNGEIVNFSPFKIAKHFIPASNVTFTTEVDSFLWIGTWDKGLLKLNTNTNEYQQFLFSTENSVRPTSNLVWHIYPISENKFLLSTDIGIVEFNIETLEYKYYLTNEHIRQTFKDSKNRFWIGTYNYHGLYLYNENQYLDSKYLLLQYTDDDPFTLTSNRVRWIYEDNSKNIWIGTEDGLNKLPATKEFYQYSYFPISSKIIGGRVVSSIVESTNDILWVGFGGDGFNKIDLNNGATKHFVKDVKIRNSLSASDIVALYEDKDGILWIGTSHGGLNKYNPNKNNFKSYLYNQNDTNSIKSNWVQQIIELNQNELLIGTNESLEVFNKQTEKFTRFKPKIISDKNILPDSISVNALCKDKKNNIWIGTWLDGLYKYDVIVNEIFHFIPEVNNDNSISSNKITSIYEDSKGRIWIGTHSGGLEKFDIQENIFTHYTTQNGLPNDVVFGVLEDEKGFLWISTMKGLVKFNPENDVFRIYDKSDGLINNQFNWHAYFKNQNDVLYFGGINGVIYFNPDKIKIDSLALPVKFTSFKVNNKEFQNSYLLNKYQNIELDYYQNFFSVEFTVLDFNPLFKHNYSYMLEGLDEKWVHAGANNIATYTDIKPGSYNFFVRSTNADGILSEISNLKIYIKPAWWMTWWFRIGLVLFIGSIIFFLYRARVHRLLELERLRLNISRDLHDEIGSNLSSISVESQMLMQLENIPKNVKEQLSIIKKTSVETMEAMRDIIWFINPQNEWNNDLVMKMRDTASKLLVGMTWTFNSPKELNISSLNLESKRNIFLIYKEVLNNIVKHSNASECLIELKSTSDIFSMVINDNGIGFDTDNLKRKNGIINIQKRAEQINGKLNIESKISNGTKIILKVEK